MRVAAEFILSALGTGEAEDEEGRLYAMVGAMELASGLFELLRLRKIIQKALKG